MSGVLIDTSVWIDHFRNGNATLVRLLSEDSVRTHPMVIGELACGTPPAPRTRTLGDLSLLLSKMCAIVRTVLFLPRTVLLTVFVSGRRHFPGARRCRLARHG